MVLSRSPTFFRFVAGTVSARAAAAPTPPMSSVSAVAATSAGLRAIRAIPQPGDAPVRTRQPDQIFDNRCRAAEAIGNQPSSPRCDDSTGLLAVAPVDHVPHISLRSVSLGESARPPVAVHAVVRLGQEVH